MTEPPRRSRAFWAGWIAAGVLLLIAAAAGVYAANLHNQLEDVELRLVDAVTKLTGATDQLSQADADVTAINNNLSVLSAADAVDFKLAGRASASDARARVFVSKSRGVLVSVTKLPQLGAGRVYQVWLLTGKSPVSAGIIRVDAQGDATAGFDVPADAATPTGAEITVEAAGGSDAPGPTIALSSRGA
jgi:hypothetical protein